MGRIILVAAADHSWLQPVTVVNLALACSLEGEETCALDACLEPVSELELAAGVTPIRSVPDIVALAVKNPALLKGYIASPSGVVLIAGVPENRAGEVRPENLARAALALAEHCGTVVVNAPRTVDDAFAALADAADVLCLATMDDLLHISRAKALRESIIRRHVPDAVFRLVVYGTEQGLSSEDISPLIRLPVHCTIPFDSALLARSVNVGKPALSVDPGAGFSEGLRRLAASLLKEAPRARASAPENAGVALAGQDLQEKYREMKTAVRRELVDALRGGTAAFQGMPEHEKTERMRTQTESKLQELVARHGGWLSRDERELFIAEMLDDVLGLGCLEGLLREPGITEIMVNGPGRVYVERRGKIELSPTCFETQEQLMTVIERIVAPIGRRIDESSPLVDARLADGSRVNAVIPPVALTGPTLTIRKFARKKLTMDDLIGYGSLTGAMAEFIKVCVLMRRNIIISGGTGSGKTTLLNVIGSFIPATERIVTLEDSAELQLPQEHVVRLESRPPSIEGTGEVPIRRLMINALRMRPDRIIVGECRGGEALDMLQAMNTGHDGSLSTLHANSPKDAIGRLATMVIMAGTELPERAVREQIGSAVNIIIQVSRLADGTRKVTEIAEARGVSGDGIALAPLFRFVQRAVIDGAVKGNFTATGELPSFIDDLAVRGIAFDRAMLNRGELS